jgi:hypothetical protein
MSGAARQCLQHGIWAIGWPVICALAIVSGSLALSAQQPATQQAAVAKSSSVVTEQPKGKAFRTPEAAAGALYVATRNNDEAALMVILGPGCKDIVEWESDPKVRQEQRHEFADRYDQMHRLVREPDNTVALYVGAENWPLPIPIVEYNGKWYFDTEAGRDEIHYRRIGRNEMEALQVCDALVDAEKEYHSQQQNYTAVFLSSGQSHDGLYWATSGSQQKSPIGPYLAHAGLSGSTTDGLEPYHGYYYKIILTQNSGGNGGGFVVLAFPAEYRSSGVMTFLVDENGNAREKDLGPNTAELAKQTNSAAPDSTWNKVE